jgi:hypothetical protein
LAGPVRMNHEMHGSFDKPAAFHCRMGSHNNCNNRDCEYLRLIRTRTACKQCIPLTVLAQDADMGRLFNLK